MFILPWMSALIIAFLAYGLVIYVLALETALVAQFGAEEEDRFRQIMTGSTGAGVIVIVFGMAVYMIICATRTIKRELCNENYKTRSMKIRRRVRKGASWFFGACLMKPYKYCWQS